MRFLDRASPPHIFTLIVLTGVGALSMNIFLPSLPAMTEHFDTDYRLMQLSVSLYLAVNAVLQIVVGPISDRYGRRPVLLWGIAIFLLATLGCLLAPTVEIFLAFRMMQAIVVVGLVLGRAVVRDMYPQDQAASQIGYVTMGMAVVPMIGPAIGGVLDETLGWQANFWMLGDPRPFVLALVWRDLGETAASGPASFAEQFANTPSFSPPAASGATASAAGLRLGRLLRLSRRRALMWAPRSSASPRPRSASISARPRIGYFFGNWLSGATRCGWASTA
jgi:DHA1 family bicyclomycin/chloramphenicol resistance-like MFS transporter